MNPSTAQATVLVRALADLGVRHAVLCPGSRSAPLAYALAAAERGALGPDRIRLHVRVDERPAGFLALGLAKESGRPAVVVTTSGTAVAHLHPAVLEASHAGVPLIVLSADRPHELRGVGANQTTDQVKLFGTAVRLFTEVPAADARAGQAAAWRNVVARAVAAARGSLSGHPGPVHVNVAFREPLTPGVEVDPPGAPDPLDGDAGLTRVDEVLLIREPSVIEPGPRTVVLAGDSAGPQAWLLAARAGWPLFAEPSSGARRGPDAVGAYRLLLDHPGLGEHIQRVVVLGHPTLSRPVQRLLGRDGVEVIVVSRRPDWPDAASRATRVLPGVALPPARPITSPLEPDGWLRRWRLAGQAAAGAIDGVLDAEAAAGRLTGPLLAREAAAALGPGQVLVAGSSNPIRDLDLAAHPFLEIEPEVEPSEIEPEVEPSEIAPGGRAVLANRGLAGIDGTLSTASGVALARAADGSGRPDRLPVRALVGDLTFLHDLGGLLVGPRERRPHLQVLVADDDGGGIFGLLEPGEEARRDGEAAATFERVFGTPHGADLGALCAGFGVGYAAIKDLPALRAALAAPPPGTSVLRARIDRAGQWALADRIAAAVTTAVTAALQRDPA